jgi:putative methyltransferase (TIGR04325 family)
LLHAARGLVVPFRQSKTQKQYESYEAALADWDIVRVVVEKTLRFRERIQRGEPVQLKPEEPFSMSVMPSREDTTVLDFGGACGYYYLLAQALRPLSRQWIVVETAETVRQAAPVFSGDELTFTSILGDVGHVDLIHASGTLPFTDKPYEYLKALIDLDAPYLFIGRLALTKLNRDIITLRKPMLSWHGPGPMPEGIPGRQVAYPHTLMQEEKFYEILNSSYEVTITFEDSSGVADTTQKDVVGLGLLAKRKV